MEEAAFETADGVGVTAVTAEEMRAVDRVAVEAVGIELLQMMENAGRTLAEQVSVIGDGSVLVVTGNGGNGGGGLACARHLANRGVAIDVVLDREPEELSGAAATQYGILDEMGVAVRVGPEAVADSKPSVVVDALIGYGLGGAVREPAASLISELNGLGASVLSLDVPSGVDATTGETLGVAVEPDRVLTLALPKTGLVGRDEPLVLADISVPATVYERLDIAYERPFAPDSWTRRLR
jgi:NAD(P)H-hydrate epimerase